MHNYLVNFAQLTQTDGSFIFGREKVDNFNLTMLKGKSILGGRKGGVPEMTLEYALKEAGLIVKQNIDNYQIFCHRRNLPTRRLWRCGCVRKDRYRPEPSR